MRSFWIQTTWIATIFLLGFGSFIALGLTFDDAMSLLSSSKSTFVALFGVGILIADVFLPVPSSLIMVAHGALLGTFIGTIISWIGSMGAGIVAYALGKAGIRFRASDEAGEDYAVQFFSKWGRLAIVASRPVPILAETVAVVAGISGIKFKTFLVALALGSFPPALIYALAGSSANVVGNTYLVITIVLIVAGTFWWIGYRRSVLG